MHFTIIVSVAFAAFATAAPCPGPMMAISQAGVPEGFVAIIMTEPDCASMKSYCTNCGE